MSDVGREIPVGDEQLPTKERKKYERKPVVRFTVEEARCLLNALNDCAGITTAPFTIDTKLMTRLEKFIKKFGTQEPSQ